MESDVSIDDVLHALADRQRRIVLRELASESVTEVTVDALQEVVVDELGTGPADRSVPRDVAIQLRHVHLPRLDDVGLCQYDAERDYVVYHGHERVESLLTFLDEDCPSEEVH